MNSYYTIILNLLKSLRGKFIGCVYAHLESDLYIVACYDDKQRAYLAKIARNVDDMQCDYDVDWDCPTMFEYVIYPRKTLRESAAKDLSLDFHGYIGA